VAVSSNDSCLIWQVARLYIAHGDSIVRLFIGDGSCHAGRLDIKQINPAKKSMT